MELKNIIGTSFLAIFLLYGAYTHAQTKTPAAAKSQPASVKQTPAPNPNDPVAVANYKFINKNYEEALGDYLKLLEGNEKNAFYNYRVGVCYVETNINKVKAKTFLEFAVTDPNVDKMQLYYYAKSLAFNLEFDKAIEQYNKFLATAAGKEMEKGVKREIEMCNNGKDLMKKTIPVTFENLGKEINSPFADYNPFISEDENFLMYNSQRPDNSKKRADGKYASNVYISAVKDGKWTAGEDIGENVNTVEGDEEIVGVCADGNTLIFYFDNKEGKGDIFVGPKMENEILKPYKLNTNINSVKYDESSATISPDGRTMYFASNRPGGLGGYDIYRARILPSGEWGEAYNLGPNVNTPYDDDFPNISLNGNTLYFSSKGHNSMGGYDVFKSEILEDSLNFSPAVNIGYPVNTPFDDKNLCMSGKGRYGYMAALRSEGLGDLDIYRITFKGVDPELSVVKGILSSNTGKVPEGATIEVFESKSNNTFGQYKVNPSTGKYVMILPPGAYFIEVSAKGFKTHSENITILDKGSFVPVIEKDMRMLSE
ncbi:MAG: PD40 domain-containing protein [Bacteroidia bacterium]|nr:PD40 domain-containing protein [Bacteroidia bacterium]MCZ2249855.1 hypothetical protein [Bacteroidia bacterium]